MPGLFDGTPLERPVTCDRCGAPTADCRCAPEPEAGPPAAPPSTQSPRVRRERRRGKWCAVVEGLQGEPAALKALLSELKTDLGCGGGVSDGELVLQGDCRDAVVARLLEKGYRVKPSGG